MSFKDFLYMVFSWCCGFLISFVVSISIEASGYNENWSNGFKLFIVLFVAIVLIGIFKKLLGYKTGFDN